MSYRLMLHSGANAATRLQQETVICGDGIERPVDQLRKSHREAYPEQYEHPAVGRDVIVPGGRRGRITRVMQTGFGPLVQIEGQGEAAWRLQDVRDA